MRFLFRNECLDRVILSLNQFVIVNFTIAMAKVSIFECLGAKQTPDLIDTGSSKCKKCFVLHQSDFYIASSFRCKRHTAQGDDRRDNLSAGPDVLASTVQGACKATVSELPSPPQLREEARLFDLVDIAVVVIGA